MGRPPERKGVVKSHTSVTIDPAVLKAAKKKKINISKFLEEKLIEEIGKISIEIERG